MQVGDTFLIPDLDDHLWIVLSDPKVEPDKAVIACMLSWRDHYDQACVLGIGDHPFVKHDTCVDYRGSRIVKDAFLQKLKTEGRLKAKEAMSASVLVRVQRSAEVSDIPSEAYDVLRRQGFAP